MYVKILTVLTSLLPIVAYSQIGSCGENLEWTLSGNTLIISGEGEMTDYSTHGSTATDKKPSWNAYKDQIESVIIQEGVTSVGGFAFYDYQSLKEVSLPNGLIHIGPMAFYNCDALQSIILPETLQSLDRYQSTLGTLGWPQFTCGSFNDCDGLKEITIPASMEYIGGNAFYNCKNLERVNWNAIDCELGFQGAHTGVRNQSSKIFYNCPIREVVFGSTTKHLHAGLFESNNLQYVTTSGSIEIIDYEAINKKSTWFLNYCTGKNLVIIDNVIYHYVPQAVSAYAIDVPAGITSISEEVFKDEKYLVKLTIPESFKQMGYNALTGCDALSEVVWNAIDCEFESSPFSSSLYRITFGDKVQVLGKNMLNGCSGIKKLTLPKSLTRIEDQAIYYCNGLKELIIPDNVTYIGNILCKNVESITVGESVDSVKYITCDNLSKIYWNAKSATTQNTIFPSDRTYDISFGNKVEEVPSQFLYRSTVNEISFGSSLKTIKAKAFQYCTFNDIILPGELENIEYSAFNESKATNLYIPASVKEIDGTLTHNVSDIIIHVNESALVPYSWANATYNIYVSDKEKYLNDRNWRSSNRLFSIAEFDINESPLTFEYNGVLPEILKNITVTCNIPGYKAEILSDQIEFRPGEYNGIKVSFRGKHDFVAKIPLAYTITSSSAAENMREKLRQLIYDAKNLLSNVSGMKADTDNWYNLNLTAENFDSNAKRLPTDSTDPFTSWDVIIDKNTDTFFHSDWNGRETTDGDDHYLQVNLDNCTMPILTFRFGYTTRKNIANAVPKQIVVYGTTNNLYWEELATISDGLPTTANTDYQSDAIESPDALSAIRIMVTSSSASKDKYNHSYFAISEFNMSASQIIYTDPIDGITEDSLNSLAQELANAREAENKKFTTEEELTAAYDGLKKIYDEIMYIFDTSALTNQHQDSTNRTAIFDIMGRRFNNTNHNGIYIINKKKYIKRQ